MIEVLANTALVIIYQHINVSNQYIVLLKLTQRHVNYISIKNMLDNTQDTLQIFNESMTLFFSGALKLASYSQFVNCQEFCKLAVKHSHG